ncbi:serine/threonine protein kinase [Aspergillus nomiae NRRL 13137]|uniref:non-specific serine/threonine protein kinase n=1 Tax=Aspergillus nomiae NRRL (strain ATCC 15546 / NRRL 13137 / CBS 260.88 / M93) TaxID=1509407 RepID=A0A0L1IJX9_ASPN3|nr:serine/threonine protein kinase [Aspergillus nomiae NRRL 13137]KNG79911.1 serine/threonine protein kinase [Aspergillus nomiae NRRL 13137]
MDGDLSLSQSLGGLRIANPDDSSLHSSEDATTPAPTAASEPPADSEPTRESTRSEQLDNPLSTTPPQPSIPPSAEYPHDAPAITEPLAKPVENRSSTYLPQTDSPQPAQQTPAYISQQPYPQSSQQNRSLGSSRPLSGLYAYANGSTSTLAAREGSYRIRTDSAASSASESQARAESRGGSAAYQAGVPNSAATDGQWAHGDAPTVPCSCASLRGSTTRRAPYAVENGQSSNGEDWNDRGAAVAVRQEIDANGKPVARYIKKGVRDFSFGSTLGEGSYSTVVLGTDRQTLKEYAIKILDKRHIIKEKKVKYVNIEKDTLNRLTEHPGIVRLYYTFQDERSLYFVLDLCKGGELLGVLKRMTTFDEECTRFYGAQILDTIDYMHKRGVIHRDLKPENVLLDSQMHIKITDFGTAKILKSQRKPDSSTSGMPPLDSTDIPEEERASSFVGTAEYVSPELLTDKNACKASDLWAFGCIIYQLLAGRPPFKAANEYLTFQKIVGLEYEFPLGFPDVARDLVERLLVLDPTRRLPIEHIKNHEFFRGMTWGPDLWKQKAPRLKAYVPPPREPIKLNGAGEGDAFSAGINAGPSSTNSANPRVVPRLVTELPPPSQLDIEWSPVLTKSNERILKLGNLLVLSSPAVHSPSTKSGGGESEAPKKFARFFGGSTTKKRQRLVMVTSSARIIMAAAGGDEKKAKLEISLLSPGTHWRSSTDSKGLPCWVVDTRDKHYVFEDPKPSSSNSGANAANAQEWVDSLDRAREMALTQQANGTYSADEAFRDISSELSSHANTLDRNSEVHHENPPGRATLVKHQPADSDSVKGKKRFSRRHSKNGLAAVF